MNKNSIKMSINNNASVKEVENISDLELIERCRKGDDMAYCQLVQRYQKRVYIVALGMVKNPDDAMDIAQDGFVKVYRYLNNFQGSSSFYTWLYRIIVNLCIDHIRKRNKTASDEYDEKYHAKESGGASAGTGVLSSGLDTNPSRNADRKELAQKLQTAIEELPSYHKAVILMREVEGMSYSEISHSLQISKGTVMSRLFHARSKLQQSLQPYLDGDKTVSQK
jgi:RNA polymerase sigma-70 factor, ECF subfamily